MTDLSLTIEKLIAAPAEAVYSAWLDPVKLTRFMTNCQGMQLSSAATDPRVGGRFSMVMNNGTRDIPHAGTYLELVPYSRIAFTWESEYSTVEGSRVTMDMAQQAGGTLVTLTHIRFSTESSRDGHRGGWTTILDGLAKAYQQAAA